MKKRLIETTKGYMCLDEDVYKKTNFYLTPIKREIEAEFTEEEIQLLTKSSRQDTREFIKNKINNII